MKNQPTTHTEDTYASKHHITMRAAAKGHHTDAQVKINQIEHTKRTILKT
jgi:hypothetical protein